MPAALYPLEAARSLRAHEQDAATETLALRLGDATRAARAREQAELALETHRTETRDVEARERALDRAGRTVAESLRARSFVERRRTEERGLVDRAQAARQAEVDAQTAAERAREALAHARAEREAVERHYEAWLAERRKLAEGREQDDAEDVVSARRLRTK